MNENSTIQLDKLVFSCSSTIKNNFNVIDGKEYDFSPKCYYGETCLTETIDPDNRYKYSYLVDYKDKRMGRVDFCLHSESWTKDRIRFTVDNSAFYNGTLHCLPAVIKDLSLEVANFSKMEIACDNYTQNTEQILRKALKEKENTVKLLGRKVKDRNKVLNEITYYNHGSLNNPFKQRTTYIRNKKNTFGLKTYDKKEEIKTISPHKLYILDYHKQKNPKYRNIYRAEINLYYKEIRRYQKKHNFSITLENLLNTDFLNSMFYEYLDRIIVVKNKNKNALEGI